ncbi:hypothetical protein Fcan01_11595 [Folsomia candida]|uniref:Uncharacterized protein n=1 Tax=Folsomia candida TaxID=158441 RepID=A0A226EAD2_FOLCA|nr:hypothetical protein Fcan01_11595 [Folsomia candida]
MEIELIKREIDHNKLVSSTDLKIRKKEKGRLLLQDILVATFTKIDLEEERPLTSDEEAEYNKAIDKFNTWKKSDEEEDLEEDGHEKIIRKQNPIPISNSRKESEDCTRQPDALVLIAQTLQAIQISMSKPAASPEPVKLLARKSTERDLPSFGGRPEEPVKLLARESTGRNSSSFSGRPPEELSREESQPVRKDKSSQGNSSMTEMTRKSRPEDINHDRTLTKINVLPVTQEGERLKEQLSHPLNIPLHSGAVKNVKPKMAIGSSHDHLVNPSKMIEGRREEPAAVETRLGCTAVIPELSGVGRKNIRIISKTSQERKPLLDHDQVHQVSESNQERTARNQAKPHKDKTRYQKVKIKRKSKFKRSKEAVLRRVSIQLEVRHSQRFLWRRMERDQEHEMGNGTVDIAVSSRSSARHAKSNDTEYRQAEYPAAVKVKKKNLCEYDSGPIKEKALQEVNEESWRRERPGQTQEPGKEPGKEKVQEPDKGHSLKLMELTSDASRSSNSLKLVRTRTRIIRIISKMRISSPMIRGRPRGRLRRTQEQDKESEVKQPEVREPAVNLKESVSKQQATRTSNSCPQGSVKVAKPRKEELHRSSEVQLESLAVEIRLPDGGKRPRKSGRRSKKKIPTSPGNREGRTSKKKILKKGRTSKKKILKKGRTGKKKILKKGGTSKKKTLKYPGRTSKKILKNGGTGKKIRKYPGMTGNNKTLKYPRNQKEVRAMDANTNWRAPTPSQQDRRLGPEE